VPRIPGKTGLGYEESKTLGFAKALGFFYLRGSLGNPVRI
jgi:hypothetical protein